MDGPRLALLEAFRAAPTEWPNGTEFVVVDVFDSGDDERGWDVVAYPMDRSGTQIDGVRYVVSTNVAVPVEDGPRRRESAAEWVGSVWREVAADTTGHPLFVAPHDYWRSFDVMAEEWVTT